MTGLRRLTSRFDSDRPRRFTWDVEDRRARLASNRRVAAFLRDLQDSQRLVIRARDMELRHFDAVFDLKDAAPAVQQVLRACAEPPESS